MREAAADSGGDGGEPLQTHRVDVAAPGRQRVVSSHLQVRGVRLQHHPVRTTRQEVKLGLVYTELQSQRCDNVMMMLAILSSLKTISLAPSQECFFFFKCWWTHVLFMGPLMAMFWNPGDVSSGLQSQSGQPYSRLAGELCDHHTSCRSIELTLGINGPLGRESFIRRLIWVARARRHENNVLPFPLPLSTKSSNEFNYSSQD